MTTDDGVPRVLVIYESMFGNTREAAEAVARGLEAEGCRVEAVEVGAAPAVLPAGLDLLVVGAPTHAFSLSRESTRADAVRQGAPEARAETGVREWLTEVSVPRPTRVAVFDTRATQVRWLPKAAGSAAAKLARTRHLTLLARPMNFAVDEVKGPLHDGEVDAAERWGRQLATDLRPVTAAGA